MTAAAVNGPLVIKHPDAKKVHMNFAEVLNQAQTLEVKDSASHARGNEILKALKGAIAIIEKGDPTSDWEGFDGPVKAAFDGHRFLVKLRDMALSPYKTAYQVQNVRMLAWEAEEKRKAQEAAQRLQEEARKLEEERALADAIAAEEAGDKQAAEEILSTPVSVPSVAVTPAIPKVEGRSVRENFKGRIVDLLKLVRHVAEHPEDLAVLEGNMPAINQRAKSQRRGFNLPGCELVVEDVASTRIG